MPDLQTTRGIVFQHITYGETSIIARIYTERFGLQSYIVKGIRSKKSRVRQNLFQPGTLVEMVVYRKENRALQHIREIRHEYLYELLFQDVRKSSVVLFIMEVLSKAIHEEEPNQGLFEFIYHSLLSLDQSTGHFASFYLVFLIKLTRYLGFYPRENYSAGRTYFNLNEGEFQNGALLAGLYIEPPLSEIFSRLLHTSYEKIYSLSLTPSNRNELLDKILEYYSLHTPYVRDIQSHLILREVFS